MKSKSYTPILLAALVLGTGLFFSCKKTPAAPPTQAVATGPSITIQQLRNMYAGINIKFTSNTILTGVVTCDESSGNLYKQVYIRDNSGSFALTKNYGAISLHFNQGASGFINTGDSIAINLNGSTLDKSGGGSLQIDSITPIDQIVHLKSGLNPQPLTVTIPQLNTYSNTIGGGFIFDGQLVQLNNVEFVSSEIGTTYAIPQAPPAAPQNVNKYLGDSLKNTIVTYNSGYSNFAQNNILIPNNSGSIVGVANLYTTMQLTIRSFYDINLNKPYNTIVYDSIQQNFSNAGLSSKSPVLLTGWTSIAYKGTVNWQGAQYGTPFSAYGNPLNWKYAPSASNFHTPDSRNDMWLISPPIVDNVYAHGASNSKSMDFSMAAQYCTNLRLLSVLVSNTFDGTHLDPTQWVDLSSHYPGIPSSTSQSTNGVPNFKYVHNPGSPFSPSLFTFDITNGAGNHTPYFYIAFRYQSGDPYGNYPDSTGSTYLLGNLVIK
ncbi:MAG TPA: DUF5689 domain-containing protein [Bacteroidia bacterium]|nr:DUF5689 domain-containing protein [Bacteroidia bacterium]